jgi:hypothetical protein
MVTRPVDVSPVQNVFPIVDPQTGRATETFQYFLLRIWERTGGFQDEFFNLLSVSNLGQIQGLIAQGQIESLERKLGDATALALLSSSLAPTAKTRVITFDSNDTYRPNPDALGVTVFCIGGGGGGGGGSIATSGSGGGGGGGGGYSWAFINPMTLPASVAVTVGSGGVGGAGGADGTDGGVSSFGTFIYAKGGNKGIKGAVSPVGQGGAETTVVGNLFRGGPGANSTLTNGDSAINDYPGAPGGGAGGGFNSGNGGAGGAGSWRSTSATGGGGTGGTGGATPTAGQTPDASDVYLGPGYGGGGGGGASVNNGADGGDGVRGAGGGGGGAIGSGGTLAGSGGNGGSGRVIVLEHL